MQGDSVDTVDTIDTHDSRHSRHTVKPLSLEQRQTHDRPTASYLDDRSTRTGGHGRGDCGRELV